MKLQRYDFIMKGHTEYFVKASEAEALIPKWISVEDRLPEKHRLIEDYLTCGRGIIGVMILDFVDGEWYDPCDGDKMLGIDYWMPLPEPPSEDKGVQE